MTRKQVGADGLKEEYRHVPVMLDEVLSALNPQQGEVVCDCTLGGAGHSVQLAKHVGSQGLLIGIDQDDMALSAASARFEREAPEADHLFLKGNFDQLDDLLMEAEVPGVDCFLFDLGVSSPQLDIAERGFSYHQDAPLDMRMDPGNNTLTAAEVINTYNEADLTRILRLFGGEKFARRIAAELVRRRSKAPIETTFELVDAIKAAIPASARRHKGHPARKTFQALRIEVNHELDALEQGLRAAVRWANPAGRICVLSYQSLEDRIVKHVFTDYSRDNTPPEIPVSSYVPVLEVMTRKPLVASDEEVARNPRARSALMRVARKLDATGEEAQRKAFSTSRSSMR